MMTDQPTDRKATEKARLLGMSVANIRAEIKRSPRHKAFMRGYSSMVKSELAERFAKVLAGEITQVERINRGSSAWSQALKQWNTGRATYCIPRRGSPEYREVMAIVEGSRPPVVKPPKKVYKKVTAKKIIKKPTEEKKQQPETFNRVQNPGDLFNKTGANFFEWQRIMNDIDDYGHPDLFPEEWNIVMNNVKNDSEPNLVLKRLNNKTYRDAVYKIAGQQSEPVKKLYELYG